MNYGQAYSAGYGNPEAHIQYFRVTNFGPYLNVVFKPAPNLGDAFFSIYRNARLVARVYAFEGVETAPIAVGAGAVTGSASVLILRDGQISDTWYSCIAVARYFESSNSSKVTLAWTWKPEIIGCVDGFSSAWVLNGLTYANTERLTDHQTWGRLLVDFTVAGSDVTVTVKLGATTLATGAGAFPGTIVLAGTLTGSVVIAGGAITQLEQALFARWPAGMQIKRGVVDPPTAVITTVDFNRADTCQYTETTDLTVTTYYYRLQPVSDSGDAGDATDTFAATVNGPPAAPTALAYSSGDAAATIISFTPTPGCSTRAYLQQPAAGFIDLANIAATTAIGVGTITLPAIVGDGTARVIVRAVSGGVEDKNVNTLDLEYDAGLYVNPRPNKPQIDRLSIAVTSGRTLAIRGLYSKQNQHGLATQLQLFYRSATAYGSTYDFTTPIATQALADAGFNSMWTATLNYTFSSNGLYYVTVKAATATGVQSTDYADEVLVDASDVNAGAPTAQIFVSRG